MYTGGGGSLAKGLFQPPAPKSPDPRVGGGGGGREVLEWPYAAGGGWGVPPHMHFYAHPHAMPRSSHADDVPRRFSGALLADPPLPLQPLLSSDGPLCEAAEGKHISCEPFVPIGPPSSARVSAGLTCPSPPPPPRTKVAIVGKNETYHRENLVGPFLVHNPPPPLF